MHEAVSLTAFCRLNIMHTALGSEIWRPGRGSNRFRFIADQSHLTVLDLREKYNNPLRRRGKKRPAPVNAIDGPSDAETEEGESAGLVVPTNNPTQADLNKDNDEMADPTQLFRA